MVTLPRRIELGLLSRWRFPIGRLQARDLRPSKRIQFDLVAYSLEVGDLTLVIVVYIWLFPVVGLPLSDLDLLKIVGLSLIILQLGECLVAADLS